MEKDVFYSMETLASRSSSSSTPMSCRTRPSSAVMQSIGQFQKFIEDR